MAALGGPWTTTQTTKSTTPAAKVNPTSISKVRVIVRVRPFLPHEIAVKNDDQTPCVSLLEEECQSGDEVVVYLKDKETSRKECYRLDSFFGQEDNNITQIFYKEVSPFIPGVFHGYNATVFAYGATGSGKTYTMQGTEELPGLMPLAMSTILSLCQKTGSKAEISYYEVYMDRCYDLLELKVKEIAVWDDKDGQIHLRGLSRVPVNSMPEFHEVFSSGIQRRKVAHTGLNDVSSRSHGVLVISVSTPCPDGSGAVISGKLNLIDLAGNEDNRRTCNEGIRLQESAKINQSLFALSNVIYALNNNKNRVPYRESKLTRILQDSLGGTSHALMVACLNPGEYQESVHTVSLAARSRNISNFVSSAQKQETPKVKVDMEAKLRAWLESKGKTKGAQRVGAFNSPCVGKTSSSIGTLKKRGASRSSAKDRVINNSDAMVKERIVSVPFRNLFNFEDPGDSSIREYWSKTLQEGSLNDSLVAPPGDETLPSPINGLCQASKNENRDGNGGTLTKSNTGLPDEASTKDESSGNITPPSPISERKNTLRSPVRKVLSPINTNGNQKPLDEFSFTDQACTFNFEPTTPKTPSILTCANIKFQAFGTPLDKFNANSSNLKSYLVQEYIDFLNTASREELVELKGIGVKTAEYILELRETSPLKSLNDLEKIGLSSKQVHNLISRAARGIFDKQEDAPSSCS
ncbi:kinesin-like protein KIN-10B [Ziziphus jujuba]|uniref:Kinesin-like protein n=1 Tax=Ziziphus jujuba TaxID=326968 RepID=A0ABM3I315_ZIZJJ|nr:kinesin-like protein KIN-10B [Ziziphus jujuba]